MLYKHEMTDPEVIDLAMKIMPVGDGQPPKTAFGWFDGQGRPRRIKVTYPNGWAATISIGVDGRIRARSATLKLPATTIAVEEPASA